MVAGIDISELDDDVEEMIGGVSTSGRRYETARCLIGVEPLSSSSLSYARYIFDMTVTVLLFASYADALGTSSLTLDLSPVATVSDVLGRVQALPGAQRLPPDPLVAVNERYAKRDRVLAAGDEIAIIPPVAGG